MYQHTLAELSGLLHKRMVSSEELTQIYLKRSEENNPTLNCYISICPEQALQQARAADKRLQEGNAGPLTGIPVAHKDIFCIEGIKTSCGSRMLDNFIAPYSATVIEKLDSAGMVTLGKTNMDEFAMGSSTETSFYGPTRNPWDQEFVPGGSSGGSATAVAARLAPVATGTDTGGSIRQPAALCGITGLKPTYGRVSRYGMIAFASSLDQGGPMTQTAEDAAMILTAITGFDPRDSTSSQRAPEDFNTKIDDNLSGLKIGLPEQYFNYNSDPVTESIILEAVKQFEAAGAKIQSIDLPNMHLSIPAYYVVAPGRSFFQFIQI